jgi:hypothetical protein
MFANSDSQANEREYVPIVLGENDYPKRWLLPRVAEHGLRHQCQFNYRQLYQTCMFQ